ncbi:hypothetical protein PC9H_002743 [Pleurotus ostreatus]|nr:uncharacterized protein PC9H_002743 [Pleurotus ostreatus]KAF7416477.1 hypothetical protein PC9H_002743 [Pleurotus ostreatus]
MRLESSSSSVNYNFASGVTTHRGLLAALETCQVSSASRECVTSRPPARVGCEAGQRRRRKAIFIDLMVRLYRVDAGGSSDFAE